MRPKTPFPLWALLAILIACVVAVTLLLPDQEVLAYRLMRDGKYDRAMQVYKKIPASEIKEDPAGFELLGIALTRHLLPEDAGPAAAAGLERAVAAVKRYPEKPEFQDELRSWIPLQNDATAAFGILKPVFARLSAEDKQGVLTALVNLALANNDPESAAQIDAAIGDQLPMSRERVLGLVKLWRYAEQPDKAVAVLEAYETLRGRDLYSLSPKLGELRIELLRELGRNPEAFEKADKLRKEEPDRAAHWLKIMQSTASDVPQQKILLQAYRELVAREPANGDAWRHVAELSMWVDNFKISCEAFEKLLALHPDDDACRKQLAQIYEWTGKPEEAFDLYFKLAEKKDLFALSRLLELNTGLYHDNEIIEILRDVTAHDRHSPYRLMLARLLNKHGAYEEAEACFRDYLERHTRDQEAIEDYADMLERIYQYSKALALYKRLAELDPKSLEVEKNIAELYYLVGNFDTAFRTYQDLARKTNDPELLDAYGNLAETLGDFVSLTEAIKRRMKVSKQVTPHDYIRLSYVLNVRGETREQKQVLHDGLEKFPDNTQIRMQLAFLLAGQRNYEGSFKVLQEYPHLKTDLTAFHLYLNLLTETKRFKTAETFLASGVPRSFLESKHNLPLIAWTYEGNRNYGAAESIYHRLYTENPGDDEAALNYARILIKRGRERQAGRVLKNLASSTSAETQKETGLLFSELGQYAEAEACLQRYLKLNGRVAFQDWTQLGDIRLLGGNRSGAHQAYEEALAAYQKKLFGGRAVK